MVPLGNTCTNVKVLVHLALEAGLAQWARYRTLTTANVPALAYENSLRV